MNRTLKVLCTRPLAQNDRWMDAVQALGLTPIALPALEIVGLSLEHQRLITPLITPRRSPQWKRAAKNDEVLQNTKDEPSEDVGGEQKYLDPLVMKELLNSCEHWIFVSGNAVRYLAKTLSELGFDWPSQATLWPIGGSTEALLRAETGFEIREASRSGSTGASCDGSGGIGSGSIRSGPKGMNSSTLYQLMRAELRPGARVTMVRGRGGLPYLAEHLLNDNVHLSLLECYQRQSPSELRDRARKLHLDSQSTVLSVFSGETLENLMAVADAFEGDSLFDCPLLVPQERLAKLARSCGFSIVNQADNASFGVMLESLEQLAHHMERASLDPGLAPGTQTKPRA